MKTIATQRSPLAASFDDPAGNAKWKQTSYPVLVENALRQLIAVSPDLQTS